MAHELLQLIDEMVASDGGPAGFSGTICVGVGDRGAMSWWRGQFGATTEHSLVEELDTDADAVFALGEQTAADIVRSGVSGDEPSYVVGDTELLARFIGRYFQNQSFVGVRANRGEQ